MTCFPDAGHPETRGQGRSPRKEPIDDGSIGSISTLLRILTLVKSRAPRLTANQLFLFLTVANREGMMVGEIARAVEDIEANVSRNIRCLTASEHSWSIGQSHGLLKLLRGATDARTRHVVLSADGRALIRQISEAFAGSTTESGERVACVASQGVPTGPSSTGLPAERSSSPRAVDGALGALRPADAMRKPRS